MHPVTPRTTQEDHEPRRTPRRGPLDQNDGVDGMGAVALKDGADEEEYFGTVPLIAADCLN